MLPVFTLKDAVLGFGERKLLEHADLTIHERDRICLVGKNGEGKSSLLKVICGEYDLDSGDRWVLPGARIGFLPQNFHEDFNTNTLEFLLSHLPKDERESSKYLVDIVASSLNIDLEKHMKELSGGQLRRVYLASALVNKPEILLLDEPTNHLDINTIEWLEQYLRSYNGAIVCISHDRSFLRNISNRTFWIDRGELRVNSRGYEDFDDWSMRVLEHKQRELDKLSKKLVEEDSWLHGGVTARRKRNQRRLQDLYRMREKMRADKAALKKLDNEIQYDQAKLLKRSKLVIEIEKAEYHIGDKTLLKPFDLVVTRGEKIGMIGPNGCGKSTLLRMIIGELKPAVGRVKIGKQIDITYYDQMRSELDPEETLWSTLCPGGGDHIMVGDRTMHVVAYLKNFMFDPKTARDKVATLSGGQANRLMLAKMLANPGSLLILDEPTNDLDMDTLDMVIEILSEYKGTLIVVSHDRDFLDRLVTKTLIFDGKGGIEDFYGSYDEFVAIQQKKLASKTPAKKVETLKERERDNTGKVSFKIKHEYEIIPQKIAEIDTDIELMESYLADNDAYEKDPDQYKQNAQKLENMRKELAYLWERWSELEEEYGHLLKE